MRIESGSVDLVVVFTSHASHKATSLAEDAFYTVDASTGRRLGDGRWRFGELHALRYATSPF